MLKLVCGWNILGSYCALRNVLQFLLISSSLNILGFIAIAMDPDDRSLTQAENIHRSWVQQERIRIALASQHQQCDIVEYHFDMLVLECPRGEETCATRCQRKLNQIKRSFESPVEDVRAPRDFLDMCQASTVMNMAILRFEEIPGVMPTEPSGASSSSCRMSVDTCRSQAERIYLKPTCKCSFQLEFVALRSEWLKDVFAPVGREMPELFLNQLAAASLLCSMDAIRLRLDRIFMDGLVASAATSLTALSSCQAGETTLKGFPGSFETRAVPFRPITLDRDALQLWIRLEQVRNLWAGLLRRLEGGGDTSDHDVSSSTSLPLIDLSERDFVVAERSRLNPLGDFGSRGLIRDHGITGEPRKGQNMCFSEPFMACMPASDPAHLTAEGLGQWQQQGAEQAALRMETLEGFADSSYTTFSDSSFATDIMESTARNDYDGRLIQLRPAEAESSRQAAQRNNLNEGVEDWHEKLTDNPEQKSPFH